MLENQSRGGRKIAMQADGASFRSDAKAEKERQDCTYVYIYICIHVLCIYECVLPNESGSREIYERHFFTRAKVRRVYARH